MMENLIKELEAIMFDVKSVEALTGGYKNDIDRGINVNHTSETVNKQDKINSLFEYLIDAKDDMDRVQDSLKDITNKLDTLLDMVEYEAIAKEIR
tara:strand:+ start:1895 stop:2179 length:285 start_codon:yes stop_codon:yes gene_type:complete